MPEDTFSHGACPYYHNLTVVLITELISKFKFMTSSVSVKHVNDSISAYFILYVCIATFFLSLLCV